MNDKPQLEKITVFQPGTHAGKRYTPGPEGLELEVPAGTATYLRERGADRRPASQPTSIVAPAVNASPAASRAFPERTSP